MSRCIVCDKATSGSLDWCRTHYNEYKDDIIEKKSWVRALKNDSQRERRRREKTFEDTSLDQIIDRHYPTRY
jgi:hypothetical protein